MSESINSLIEAEPGKALTASALIKERRNLLLLATAAIGNNALFFGGIATALFGLSHGNVPLAWMGGLAAVTALTVSTAVAAPALAKNVLAMD